MYQEESNFANSVLIAKFHFFVFVFKILLTSLSIKNIFNMIKYFVVGCFFKASLSRLAANRLSSSAKTWTKSSVSSSVQLQQRTFALLILFTFLLLLLRVDVGLFYKKSPCLMLSVFTLKINILNKNLIYVKKMITQIFCIFCMNINFFTVFTLIT